MLRFLHRDRLHRDRWDHDRLHRATGLAAVPLLAVSIVVFSAATAPSAWADEKPLPALVPADVGICLESRGLAAAVREFRSSAHFERLGEFPPWRRWREKDGRDLAAVSEQMASLVGIDAGEFWERVVGHQMLLAIWPDEEAEKRTTNRGAANSGTTSDTTNSVAASGKAAALRATNDGSHAPAVLLVRAADAEALRKAAEGFTKAQQFLERVSWQAARHGGIDYQLGSRPGKRPAVRLAVVGNTAVLSDHERLFHRVLDLMPTAPAATNRSLGSLAELPAYAAAVKDMPPGAAVKLFVNPRAWEPILRAEAAAAPAAEQAQKQLLLKSWQAVESCWASFELTPRMRLQAVIKYDRQALPAPVGEFMACFSGPSGFLAKVPEGALLAAATRVDPDRFITWARKYGAPEKQPQPAEAEVIVSLLRLLGPDLGVYLKPHEEREGDSTQWLQWVGAIAVRPQMPPERESLLLVQAAVEPLLAGFAKSFSESGSSRLAGILMGDGLRTLSDSLRLSRAAISSVTLADGRVWVAGTQRALQEAQAVGGEKSLARSARWTSQLGDAMREPSHVLYVDCSAWGRLLGRHADALVATTVRERGVDDATARRGLQQLLSLLRLADTLVAAVKIDDGRIAASLSAAVEPPSSPSLPRGEPAVRP